MVLTLEASDWSAGALGGFVDGGSSSAGSGGLGGSMISSGAGDGEFILRRGDVGRSGYVVRVLKLPLSADKTWHKQPTASSTTACSPESTTQWPLSSRAANAAGVEGDGPSVRRAHACDSNGTRTQFGSRGLALGSAVKLGRREQQAKITRYQYLAVMASHSPRRFSTD